MKLAKASVLSLFVFASGCGTAPVPKVDEIEAMINAGDVSHAQAAILRATEAEPANRRVALLDGRIAVETGNYDRAQSKLAPLLADPALGAQARVWLARAKLMAGQPRDATKLLGAPPYDSALAFAVAGGARMAAGDAEAADALLTQGLAAFPQSADLQVLAGERALQEGDRGHAAALVGEALKRAPKDVQAQLFAARVALAGRDLGQAERHFNAVLALRPKHQTALLGKAAIAYDRGDRAAAAKILADAAESLGQNAVAVGYFRAQIAYDAGKVEEANAILMKLGNADRFPPAVMLAGLVAARRGQHEQAIALLNRFLSQGGEDGRARVALAEAYRATGDKAPAWKALQPVADAANAPPAVLGLAAQLTADLGLPASAGYKARQTAAANPGQQGRQLAAADAAIRAGNWAKADAIYADLLARDPASTNIILLNNAAMAAAERGDLPRAVTLGRRAAAAAPNDPIVLDTLAWAMFRTGGPTPEAVGLMRRALAAMPGNPEIRQHALAFQNALQRPR